MLNVGAMFYDHSSRIAAAVAALALDPEMLRLTMFASVVVYIN
jgi:hypothetical protein